MQLPIHSVLAFLPILYDDLYFYEFLHLEQDLKNLNQNIYHFLDQSTN